MEENDRDRRRELVSIDVVCELMSIFTLIQ